MGVAGERRLPEWEVPWLDGFLNSRPVRVGNAAAEQFQLDIYGEVADAMAQALKGGLPPHPRTRALSETIMPFLEQAWRRPDEGIWETRGGLRHFTHSKVMAWVAFDRAAQDGSDRRSAPASGQPAGAGWRTKSTRRCAGMPSIRASAASCSPMAPEQLDASLLAIPLVGFLPPEDPRVVGTVAAIERHLVRDGLVMRYDTGTGDDGLPPGEGAFLACSFWLADVLVLLGRHDEARRLFERLLSLCNDVGLLAEEYDPLHGRMLGNFPQAFSHIGLINTALESHADFQPRRRSVQTG